jgi:hypothetical protein
MSTCLPPVWICSVQQAGGTRFAALSVGVAQTLQRAAPSVPSHTGIDWAFCRVAHRQVSAMAQLQWAFRSDHKQ